MDFRFYRFSFQNYWFWRWLVDNALDDFRHLTETAEELFKWPTCLNDEILAEVE